MTSKQTETINMISQEGRTDTLILPGTCIQIIVPTCLWYGIKYRRKINMIGMAEGEKVDRT